MANDITGINSGKPQEARNPPASAPAKPRAEEDEPAAPGSQSKDTVSLTDTAEKLKALEKQLSQEPPVNTQKIADVRAALENGNYQLDAEKIAKKMIDFETHLEK